MTRIRGRNPTGVRFVSPKEQKWFWRIKGPKDEPFPPKYSLYLKTHPMPSRLCLLALLGLASPLLRAQEPLLLAKALERWTGGEGDVAFTQETRGFQADGNVKEERVERYDPSLPDSRRWRLVEVNGLPATDEQRRKWESRKNGKPRRKVDEKPSEYFELDHAVLIGETPKDARFRVPVRPEAKLLLSLDEVDVVLTVDKQTGSIAGIGAALREPIRVLLGLARITDLDVDIRIAPVDEAAPNAPDGVESGSTARVTMSKLGRPVEYNWSDFKRVAPFAGP